MKLLCNLQTGIEMFVETRESIEVALLILEEDWDSHWENVKGRQPCNQICDLKINMQYGREIQCDRHNIPSD